MSIEINNISIYLNKIEDNTVRCSFLNFIEFSYSNHLKFIKKHGIKIYKSSIKIISNYIKNISFNEINWKFLCSTMHHNNLISFIDTSNLDNSKINKICNTSKQFLKSYLLYLINNDNYSSNNLNELRLYKHLIKDLYEPVDKSYLPSSSRNILEKYILTSYPLDSIPKCIYQVSDKSNKKFYNLNINSSNDFIISLMKGFIDRLAYGTRVNASHRVFYYYFEESFGDLKVPSTIEEFTAETFDQQVKFYDNIMSKLNFNGLLKSTSKTYTAVVPPKRILVQLYLHLIDYIDNHNINYNIFENSWITKQLLKSTSFLKLYLNGYTYVYYNKLEDVPIFDKWWLSPGEDSKKSIKLAIANSALDFTNIHDINLRKKVMEWIWYGYGNSNIIRRMKGINVIIDFLKYKDNYEKQLEKVTYINKEKIAFSIELFYRFRLSYQIKYPNIKTLNEHFIDLRSFLNFISDEYYINKKCFKYLEIKKTYNEDICGCPITKKDFKLILNEFKHLEKELDYGVLLTNIFYLASTTNLRPSEILSLERDCIVYHDENGNGTIKLKRKTSKGIYVHQELDTENIKLIQSSILISNRWLDYVENFSHRKFIFIGKVSSNTFGNNYCRLNSVFSDKFRNIILKLEPQLDNYYTPYNLRDTFINIVYDNFKKYDETDIDKLQRITGNSYNVVMKHYRRKFAIKEYVELMSKVIVNDVDINGHIVIDDSKIDSKLPVGGDLGACDLVNCAFNEKINYDTESQCLICNNFITSLSRIKAFEKKIQIIRQKIDSLDMNNTISELERNILLNDLKLYSAYLTKMLEIKYKSN